MQSLITDSEQWDEKRLNELFWPVNSDFIYSISLSITSVEDQLIQHFDKEGESTVRSGYAMGILKTSFAFGSLHMHSKFKMVEEIMEYASPVED